MAAGFMAVPPPEIAEASTIRGGTKPKPTLTAASSIIDFPRNGPNGGRSAKEKLDAAIGKVSFLCSASQLAAAATQESTLFAGQTNAASLDAQNGDVYCETGTAIDPSGDDAGQIPSTKDRLTCADTVGSELGKLAAAKVNVVAMDAVAAGSGRWGAILWVAPRDLKKAAGVLGAM